MLFKEAVEPVTLELLENLMLHDKLKNFSLAGGTALALYYGHRISVDIDLFTEETFNEKEILKFLETKYNLVLKDMSQNYLLLEINNVRVDIITHQYSRLDEVAIDNGIRIASLKDISAMKLNAICNRGTKKDFWDLYFLLNQFSLNEMLNCFSEKYQNRDLSMVLKSLVYFEDANKMPPLLVMNKQLTWDKVKERISLEVRNYFNEF